MASFGGEGAEISPEDRVQWAALSPVRGQVLEVFLPETDTHDPPFAWAAFLIGRVSTRLDGSIVLECRHLGAEDTPYSQVLDGQFNDARRHIHLCLTRPCLMTEEKDDADTSFMHVTRIRLWSWDRFISVQEYVAASSLDAGVDWLKATEAVMPSTPGRRSRNPPKEKEKPTGRKKETKKPKAKEGPRKREHAAEEEEPETSGKGGKPKKKEEEKATREELRSRLKAVRERLQDPGTIRVEDGYSPGTPVAEDVSSGSEDEGSSCAPEKRLTTGANLGEGAGALAKAVARKGHPRSSHRHHRDALPLEDTKDSTLKGLSGQLLKQALAAKTQRAAEKKRKKKKQSKKTDMENLTAALAKVFGRTPEGEQKEKKGKKKTSKKKRKLQDGTIVSCSSNSSSYSDEVSEAVSSDEDLEAPLRKKSRDHPGSVLRMLVSHIQEQLDQSALTELGHPSSTMTSGVKVMTYFNLHVKSSYPHQLREMRELHHLAACLDLVRKGDLARAADGLAARFIAIHQSLVDGSWQMAKHLELFPLEEASAAGAAALLATRKHARLISKVQGPPPSTWTPSAGRGRGGKGRSDWNSGDGRGDYKGENKGKGKGKKGGRGKWDQRPGWEASRTKEWEKNKEKTEEKPKG